MKHEMLWLGALMMVLSLFNVTGCQKGAANAMLVVSFGTSYPETREKTIGAIEGALAKGYPDYQQRRAFTSKIIIDKLKQRDGIVIDNVSEALLRLEKDGVKDVVVQPTLVMKGIEYDTIINDVKPFASKFKTIRYGTPLLSSDHDFDEFTQTLTEETRQYDDGETAIVFMGHGTEHDANEVYGRLDEMFIERGFPRHVIGTVEAEPSLEDALARVEALGVRKVVLLPLMIVAGDHATNDMAGDEDDSWKSVFEARGYQVTPVLRGLGEYAGIQRMFTRHAGEAISKK